MMFNINNNVRVKLTDVGRKILFEQREKEIAECRRKEINIDIPMPIEDENGWSKWQLWNLMEELGSHCRLGHLPPFETTIEIVDI